MHTAERSELICLISIDSTHFSRESLEAFTDWAEERNAAIRHLVLEYPERHNIRAFEGLSEKEALELAKARGRECRERLGLKAASVVSWEQLSQSIGFEYTLGKVLDCFQCNGSFRRHCLSRHSPIFSRVFCREA